MIKTKHVLYTYDGKAWHMIYFKSEKIIKSLFNRIVSNQCMDKIYL